MDEIETMYEKICLLKSSTELRKAQFEINDVIDRHIEQIELKLKKLKEELENE